MERLKSHTGKVVTETLEFEGSVKDFKDYILTVCEKYSPQDEVELYGDTEGYICLLVKEYSFEPSSEYKQRVLNKIKELEEIVKCLEDS